MARPARSALPWLWLSLALVLADQASKQLALSTLLLHDSVPVIPGWFDWTLTYNYGAAFSFLSDASGWQRWFFSALAVAISTVLVVWLARLPRNDWRQALPFALIIGGALGNLVDRLRFGYVVDFIDLHHSGWHFPAFNLADSGISVGAVLLVVFGLGGNRSADVRS
jgi:signal peptidase II